MDTGARGTGRRSSATSPAASSTGSSPPSRRWWWRRCSPWWAWSGGPRPSATRSCGAARLLRTGFDARLSASAEMLHDHAFWDEAYEKAHLAPAPAACAVDNIGAWAMSGWAWRRPSSSTPRGGPGSRSSRAPRPRVATPGPPRSWSVGHLEVHPVALDVATHDEAVPAITRRRVEGPSNPRSATCTQQMSRRGCDGRIGPRRPQIVVFTDQGEAVAA